ncbi:MAG: hypothetical protein Q4G28_06450 [Neisseria sp.]|nr:hypothetical protein [Neisseria sp.]
MAANDKKKALQNGLAGILAIGFGWYNYQSLIEWEQNGSDERSAPRLMAKIYELAGAEGILAFFVVAGVILLAMAYRAYQKSQAA